MKLAEYTLCNWSVIAEKIQQLAKVAENWVQPIVDRVSRWLDFSMFYCNTSLKAPHWQYSWRNAFAYSSKKVLCGDPVANLSVQSSQYTFCIHVANFNSCVFVGSYLGKLGQVVLWNAGFGI